MAGLFSRPLLLGGLRRAGEWCGGAQNFALGAGLLCKIAVQFQHPRRVTMTDISNAPLQFLAVAELGGDQAVPLFTVTLNCGQRLALVLLKGSATLAGQAIP